MPNQHWPRPHDLGPSDSRQFVDSPHSRSSLWCRSAAARTSRSSARCARI